MNWPAPYEPALLALRSASYLREGVDSRVHGRAECHRPAAAAFMAEEGRAWRWNSAQATLGYFTVSTAAVMT